MRCQRTSGPRTSSRSRLSRYGGCPQNSSTLCKRCFSAARLRYACKSESSHGIYYCFAGSNSQSPNYWRNLTHCATGHAANPYRSSCHAQRNRSFWRTRQTVCRPKCRASTWSL